MSAIGGVYTTPRARRINARRHGASSADIAAAGPAYTGYSSSGGGRVASGYVNPGYSAAAPAPIAAVQSRGRTQTGAAPQAFSPLARVLSNALPSLDKSVLNRIRTAGGDPLANLTPKERRVVKRGLSRELRSAAGSGLLDELNRGFGPNEQISPRQAAIVAESEGLPGITYAQIAKGESNFRPGAANPDDAYESLWQMTPSVQSNLTRSIWNRIASKYPGGSSNPIVSAKQAAVLAGQGTGVSNYFGTGFVTDENAHLPGGERRADKLLYGEKPPRKLVGAGIDILGKKTTKKLLAPPRPPRPLETKELFYDPGINLADGEVVDPIGGHDTHLHYGSTDPRSILRAAVIAQRFGGEVHENPAWESVDPVHTEGSMHYQNMRIPKKLLNSRLYRRSGAQGRILGEAFDVGDASGVDLGQLNEKLAGRSGAPSSGASPFAIPGTPYGGPLGAGTGAVSSAPPSASAPAPRPRAGGGGAGGFGAPLEQRVSNPFGNLGGAAVAGPADLLSQLMAAGIKPRPRRRRESRFRSASLAEPMYG
jgi:hypothetical protein